jgi:hypothetical protein
VKKTLLTGLLALSVFFGSGPAFAQSNNGEKLQKLESQILMLENKGETDELQLLRAEMDRIADIMDNYKYTQGAQSKYDRGRIYGYGETHYTNNVDENGGNTVIDMHRFVIGVNAVLSDWIQLNAEVDYEHGAQELEFELGYLDFRLHQAVSARAGVLLMPVGLLNEFHEPNLFWSTERPQLQNKIIPTTWNASGAGIFGTPVEGVNYRVYAVNSVQSIRPSGFSSGSGSTGNGGQSGRFTSSSGIRSGRAQPNNVIAEDFAATGRLELTKLFPGFQAGFSFYVGNTTQGNIEEGGRILLTEADMKYRWNWFDMNASIANIDINDAAAMNAYCATQNGLTAGTCSTVTPDNIFGWNVQAGIHIPQLLGVNTSHDLITWFMFEHIRPQDSMPSGAAPSAGVNFDVYQAGITYKPIFNVAIKADWQHRRFSNPNYAVGAVGKAADTVNLGVAFMY